MNALRPKDFADWRRMARALISRGVPPDEILWADPSEELLFAGDDDLGTTRNHDFTVPRKFVSVAVRASLFRDTKRWDTIYRVLWKIVRGSREVLSLTTDPDVASLYQMDGEVRRDCHKMKAFVRFRKDPDGSYVAWHQPSHLIVKAVAPFFARRFNTMKWAILTPDCSAYWDQVSLRFGPGVSRSQAPDSDALEELWKTYYANIFNPARVKISAMVSEMPRKYWHTMPETAIISELLLEAPERVKRMLDTEQRELPAEAVRRVFELGGGLIDLADEAASCQGCELCHSATQAVFGQGPQGARIAFVGEQPGDQEDRQGLPFVGPAGQLLRRCLRRVNLDPSNVYLTNVVKHFRWEPSTNDGKKRLHKRATWRQIEVCRPWVEAELRVVRPKVVVLLGATALQALLGADARIGKMRGQILKCDLAPKVLATVHPSSLLRIKDNRLQQREVDKFCRELQVAVDFAKAP
jgi:uracil-DNA glycosylase